MLVSSVLTLILISVAFYSYSYLVKNFVSYQAINENIGDQCRLQVYMEDLVQKANEVYRTKEGIAFAKKGDVTKDLILSDEYIVFKGNNGASDTLHVKLNRTSFKWNEDSMISAGSPVQSIELEIEFSKKAYTLNFEKAYDSERSIVLDSIYKSLK
jgi:hypothetical protein